MRSEQVRCSQRSPEQMAIEFTRTMLIRAACWTITILIALSTLACSSGDVPNPVAEKRERPISQVMDDVRTRLDKDTRLQGSKITTTYDGGTVILTGTVLDRSQLGWAATVAAGTPGVKGVINRLQVEAQPTPVEPPNSQPRPEKPQKPGPTPTTTPTP